MEIYYFYADFENYTATISNNKPTCIIYKEFPIKWKNNGTIILASNITINFKKMTKSNKQIVSLLKSSLQKQIRRQLISSHNTCNYLLVHDSFELFRRLVVISFEDVIPNIHTSLICWLMAASSKGLIINDEIKNFTYNYIQILLECTNTVSDNLIFDNKPELSINIINKCNHIQKDIIKAIYFRTAYGGLKGDVIMINNVLTNYLENNIELKNYKKIIEKITIPKILYIHICGIDHHIYPAIVDHLYSKFNRVYPKELLQIVIWECNSKKNTRKNQDIKSEYKEIFNIIKPELRKLQYQYLNNIIYLI
jgi:hypothetical protein